MSEVGAVVVGGGVVGLAIGRALAVSGRETLILESAPRFGEGTSSRNSGVIHAGIYYKGQPLKARLCVEGRGRLYAYCESRGVPHRRIGKLIFAHTPDQIEVLDGILATARAADVEDLAFLDAHAARALEPALECAGALLSPSTGVIDIHAYMQALLADAEAHGANLVCNTRVTRLSRAVGGWGVRIEGEAEPVVTSPVVVNAAGLGAHALAAVTDGLAPEHLPPSFLARGVYFEYAGRVPFQRLIYPVPEPGGLGTHLTFDLAGQARFGPDVEWISAVDYTVDPGRHERFAAAARRIWRDLDPDRLHPGYAGIRPKISGPGEPAADFRIDGPADHGLEGLVNLFGIESPGLTASLAVAEEVARRLDGAG